MYVFAIFSHQLSSCAARMANHSDKWIRPCRCWGHSFIQEGDSTVHAKEKFETIDVARGVGDPKLLGFSDLTFGADEFALSDFVKIELAQKIRPFWGCQINALQDIFRSI
jgi:hypothetical protein